MTIAVAEAATGARAAGAAEGASARQAAAARRPAARRPVTFREPRPLPAPRQPRRPRAYRPQSPAGQGAFDFYKRQATASRGGSLDDYQPVILAEFVAAILLVALSPVARGTPRAAQGQVGLSPYGVPDMVQLGAITLTYLILALVSTGTRDAGRVSAWFGGLILFGLGLVKTGTIAKILDLFGAGGAPPAGVEAGGQNLAGIVNQGITKDTTGTAGG